jgi:tRNA nucleotidyltransferase (CCA-adding enzyme)
VRVAALCHDFGKALTPGHRLPTHPGHEAAGVPVVEAFCARLRVPAEARDLAVMTCREHLLVHTAKQLRPETVMALLERCDALRRAPRFAELLLACECDARGRTGLEARDYDPPDYLRGALAAALTVLPAEVARDGYTGPALGAELRERRLRAISIWREANRHH